MFARCFINSYFHYYFMSELREALLDHCKYHECKVHISSCIFHKAGRTDSVLFPPPFYVVIIPPSESEGEPSSFAARWESAGTARKRRPSLNNSNPALCRHESWGGLKNRQCERRMGVCVYWRRPALVRFQPRQMAIKAIMTLSGVEKAIASRTVGPCISF